jgi:hypothetical protein
MTGDTVRRGKRWRDILFIRNTRALNQLEVFLVSAVSIILLIRIFLELTGYPQLGGGRLHIAHMLWGGLGMLVAALLRLMLMGKWVEYAGAFIGGLGFGAFIDEIGKFVTQDNDYFFAPSFSLMYIIFVLIYLVAHWALASRGYSRTEYLMNSLNLMQEYRRGYLDANQVGEMRSYLEQADGGDPLTVTLSRFIDDVDTVPATGPGYYQRLRRFLARRYYSIIEKRLFVPLLITFFIVQLVVGMAFLFEEVLFPQGLGESAREPGFSDSALLVTSITSGLFILLGVLSLRRSRLTAYKMFERAMLVNILLSQVFLFTINQLGAVTGLVFSLLVLGALRFLIGREEQVPAGRHDCN